MKRGDEKEEDQRERAATMSKKEIKEYSTRPISRGLELMEEADRCDLLIVDDESSIRGFLEGYFKRMIPGIKIELAKDGEEGYRLALKFRPCIIWTCIRMPRMNGLDLIKLIKKNPDTRDAKVIVYSGYGSKEIRNQTFELGADARRIYLMIRFHPSLRSMRYRC